MDVEGWHVQLTFSLFHRHHHKALSREMSQRSATPRQLQNLPDGDRDLRNFFYSCAGRQLHQKSSISLQGNHQLSLLDNSREAVEINAQQSCHVKGIQK